MSGIAEVWKRFSISSLRPISLSITEKPINLKGWIPEDRITSGCIYEKCALIGDALKEMQDGIVIKRTITGSRFISQIPEENERFMFKEKKRVRVLFKNVSERQRQ